ncbi:DUF2818 family protein [Acidithiobacillus sp. AMEEHan]|uniref:DUF2818 family protein n=1 Tax=Acidithiobacillus sp. AMEEHan TaxID=2994951 RepID=UPI0027E4CAF4|nr:DUF2818 family protein [Acidithiobacillus sp. AMEEHan]
MAMQQWAMIYILVSFIAANLPWLSRKRFVFGSRNPKKTLPWYLGEWFAMYVLMGLIGMGLERFLVGHNHAQGWEFYVIALCMFAVFAIPGFIWRFNIVPMLRRS